MVCHLAQIVSQCLSSWGLVQVSLSLPPCRQSEPPAMKASYGITAAQTQCILAGENSSPTGLQPLRYGLSLLYLRQYAALPVLILLTLLPEYLFGLNRVETGGRLA